LRPRKLPCWIESFISETEGLPTPPIFRRWAAITTLGGALERRVWAETAMSRVYANLFVLLVSPPGVGKSVAMTYVRDMVDKTRKLKVAPDDVTKANLVDKVAAATTSHVYSAVDMLQYHSLQIIVDELGVLLSSHDLSFLSVMNALYDNRAYYSEGRRSRSEDIVIENPQINFLGGTQPDFLANLLPPEAWGMGFMSRTVMIYHGSPIKPRLFGAKLKMNFAL
jgi:hypothetical protein